MVGLPPVDRALFKDTHPITYSICSLAHKGNNLDRYIVGRQFMVLVIVFAANQCGAALEGARVFGLPAWFNDIFLGSSIFIILVTACLGQLMSQVNASHCMLDFVNTHFMTCTLSGMSRYPFPTHTLIVGRLPLNVTHLLLLLFTTVCLIIEASGLLHCVYIVPYLLALVSGRPVQSNEDPRNWVQAIFFWGRVLMSLGILAMCLAVTLSALVKGQTTAWQSIPDGISVIVLFLCLYVVGMLEGMQIAVRILYLPNFPQRNLAKSTHTCRFVFLKVFRRRQDDGGGTELVFSHGSVHLRRGVPRQ
jgi:hypothetical protein